MLLQFTVENFQSIKKRTTLDMLSVQGKEITEFKDSLIGGKTLPVAVIYGPNGGGKTTMLKAFQAMQILITRYFNVMGGIAFNQAFAQLQVSPFLLDKDSREKPTTFEIMIELKERQYKYGLVT